ncbi:MAG TPA: oligosaccharide flippase family protein [Thermoguttaceae bacterium]|nr:oligosaccharide flippase family protein [Thermoguttaceae bacterium]
MSGLTVKNVLHACCPGPLRPYWDRVEGSELGSRLARGAFWSLAGAVISRGMMLAASVFVARLLGREVFGEFGIIRNTVTVFGTFVGISLGMIATKHVAEFRRADPQRAGRIVALSGLAAFCAGSVLLVLLYCAAPWLASHVLAAPHLAGLMRVGSLLLLLNLLTSVQTGVLAGFEAFKTIAKVSFGVGALSFPVLLCGTSWGGLQGAVWGLIFTFSIHWTLNHLAIRRAAARAGVAVGFRHCLREKSLLWKFGLPVALGSSMAGILNWSCGALLVNREGGYGEMGIFVAANHWRITILFIPEAVRRIVLPMLSSLGAKHDHAGYVRFLKFNAVLNGGIALALALPVVVLSPWIMASYGEGFQAGVLPLVLIACSTPFVSVNSVVEQAIISRGRMWLHFSLRILKVGAIVAATYYLLDLGYGAAGLATAYVIGGALHTALLGGYFVRTLRDPFRGAVTQRDLSLSRAA